MRDSKRESSFAGLNEEVSTEFDDVRDEWKELGVTDKKMKDGTLKIKSWKQLIEDGFRWTDEGQLTDSYIPPEEGKEKDESPSNTNLSLSCGPPSFAVTNNTEMISRLATLGLEDYASTDSAEDADEEESESSSDSDAYADARSTLSSEDEQPGSSTTQRSALGILGSFRC